MIKSWHSCILGLGKLNRYKYVDASSFYGRVTTSSIARKSFRKMLYDDIEIRDVDWKDQGASESFLEEVSSTGLDSSEYGRHLALMYGP